jgi:hypothetical protein
MAANSLGNRRPPALRGQDEIALDEVEQIAI